MLKFGIYSLVSKYNANSYYTYAMNHEKLILLWAQFSVSNVDAALLIM